MVNFKTYMYLKKIYAVLFLHVCMLQKKYYEKYGDSLITIVLYMYITRIKS